MRSISNARLLAVFVLVSMLSGQTARAADVEIRVDSVSLDVSTGFVDLDVFLINQTGAAVNFGSFNLNLEITPLSPRAIQFDSATQPDMFASPLYETYIFYNDSDGAAQDAPYSPWSVFSVNGTDDQYLFTDSTLTGSPGVSVPDGESRLLARVRIVVGTAQAGDSFTVAVVGGEIGTLLSDPDFVAVPFTITNGTVTAVPEPGTIALAGIGAMFMVVVARRRRKSAVTV